MDGAEEESWLDDGGIFGEAGLYEDSRADEVSVADSSEPNGPSTYQRSRTTPMASLSSKQTSASPMPVPSKNSYRFASAHSREPAAAGSLPISIPGGQSASGENTHARSDDSGFLPPHEVAADGTQPLEADELDAIKKSRDLALRTDVLRRTGFLEHDAASVADPRSVEISRHYPHSLSHAPQSPPLNYHQHVHGNSATFDDQESQSPLQTGSLPADHSLR